MTTYSLTYIARYYYDVSIAATTTDKTLCFKEHTIVNTPILIKNDTTF